MVKRGSLNNVEKFYIDGHSDLPVAQLATDLDRSTGIIEKYISITAQSQPAEVPAKGKKQDTAIMAAMGRHERNGQKVATVMTRAASELADAQRPQRISSKKIQDAIHRPCD